MAGEEIVDNGEGDPPRRARSNVGKWVLRVVAGLAALLAIGLVVLNSPIGHRFVTDQIAKVAPASGLGIRIGRIEGDLFGEAVLHDVTLSDPQGPFLTVPVVELDWRPLNWFWSGLDVRKLIARRGTLLRLPELNPGDPDAPILPDFDIRVDRFELDRLRVAEGVLGEERVVNLVAEADVQDGRVYLAANGELGGEDRLYLLVDAEPDGDLFDIELDYRAPQGGLLAGLVGAEDDLRVIVTGDGTWEDWDGAFLARQGGERLAALRLTANDGRYGILGRVRPDGYVSGIPADALGEAVSVQAGGTLIDSVLDGNFMLVGSGLRAEGEGAIDFADNAFGDLNLAIRLTDPGLLGDGNRIENARLDATLDGPFRDLSVGHELSVERLDMGGTVLVGLTQEGTANFDGTRWTLPLDLTVERMVTGNEIADPRLVNGRLSGTVVLTGNRLASDNLTASFPGLGARLNLRGNIARGGYALAGSVAARGLMLENLGTIDGNAKINFAIGNGVPWRLSANFAGSMPRIANDTLESITGGNIRFRGGVSLGGAAPIRFREIELNSEKLTLDLSGSVEGGETQIAGSGQHTDYGPFTVEARLTEDGPYAELVFADPLPAAGLEDVRVALSPIEDGFRIDTSGGSMLGPFEGVVNLFQQPDGPTRLAIERLDIWKTSVRGEVTLTDDGAEGRLLLEGGGINGAIALVPRGGEQGVAADLTVRNASFGGDTPIAIGFADIDVQGSFGGGGTTVEGTVQARGITYGDLFLGALSVDAQVTDGRGTFDAVLAGRRGTPFHLQLNGQFAPERIAVAARGEYAGRDISMPRRAVLTKTDDGGWSLARTQISFGGGTMLVDGRMGGTEPPQGRLQLAEMPLSLIDAAGFEYGLGGTISGIVEIGTAGGGQVIGEARVMVDGLTRSGLVLTSKPIDIALVADLSPTLFQARVVLREDGRQYGRAQLRIAELPQSGGLFERLQAGAMLAQLRYKGPASALWRLAALEAFDITGEISVAANARGTLRDPIVRGSLAGDSLRVQSALTGTNIGDVRARGTFEGSRLRLTSFAGTAANGGSVSGSGTVDLSNMGGGRGPSIDLRIAARNARLLDRSDMAASVTGPLRIVSSGIGGTIAGRVRVDDARWQLGNAATEVELPDIETREINLPPDIRQVQRPGQPWHYLINATAPGGLDVRGMGLESEWSADIRLRGTTADPRIGGSARVVPRQGSYTFAGTRFDITRGVIDFDQSVPPDPRLNIVAETDVQDLHVTVSVSGTASQPEIEFSSTPPLPDEEILARLLFGGSIADLSATDALQLGAALASLRGGGGGLDPINRLRTAVGLDRLRIVPADPALDRGTAIAMGKRFGDNFYVELVTDGQGYSATQLEYRITGWLTLLATVSTIGRESVAVEFSRDY